MEDQEMQAQFIQWLAQKTGAKTEDELKQVIMKLQSDKGQMQQVMQEFQAEMSGGQPTMQRAGGKLAYLRCLSQFKKGGKVDCGCGGAKMEKGAKVPKAFLGAVMGAIKGAGAIAKGGASVAKGAQALATAGKVAGMANKAIGIGQQVAGALKPRPAGTSTNATGLQGYQTMPNINTPTMPSFQVGMVDSPNDVPGGRVLYPGVQNSVQDTTPKLVEKGAKLKAKKLKK